MIQKFLLGIFLMSQILEAAAPAKKPTANTTSSNTAVSGQVQTVTEENQAVQSVPLQSSAVAKQEATSSMQVKTEEKLPFTGTLYIANSVDVTSEQDVLREGNEEATDTIQSEHPRVSSEYYPEFGFTHKKGKVTITQPLSVIYKETKGDAITKGDPSLKATYKFGKIKELVSVSASTQFIFPAKPASKASNMYGTSRTDLTTTASIRKWDLFFQNRLYVPITEQNEKEKAGEFNKKYSTLHWASVSYNFNDKWSAGPSYIFTNTRKPEKKVTETEDLVIGRNQFASTIMPVSITYIPVSWAEVYLYPALDIAHNQPKNTSAWSANLDLYVSY